MATIRRNIAIETSQRDVAKGISNPSPTMWGKIIGMATTYRWIHRKGKARCISMVTRTLILIMVLDLAMPTGLMLPLVTGIVTVATVTQHALSQPSGPMEALLHGHMTRKQRLPGDRSSAIPQPITSL